MNTLNDTLRVLDAMSKDVASALQGNQAARLRFGKHERELRALCKEVHKQSKLIASVKKKNK